MQLTTSNNSSAISNKDTVSDIYSNNCYKVTISTDKLTYLKRDDDDSECNKKNSGIKIKNPCIEKYIPLKIEKDSVLKHPDQPHLPEIYDKSIDDYAKFYTAIIKLGDKKIGEFHTRYVPHWGAYANEDNIKHIVNFFNPIKSFQSNEFSKWENWILENKNNKFVKLIKENNDFFFKICDINGHNVTNDKKFIFPSNLVNFNKDYIKNLSDLNEHIGSIYVASKSKLYEHFNNKEDYLHIHPIEIREFSLTSKHVANTGELIGILNHEYGIFREFADDKKREFIFSDVVTKGKNIIITTDEDHVAYSRNKDENEEPQKAFLFLAKYKDDTPCQNHYYNNSELKIKDYVLGFANEKGCVKMISNTHLDKGIDLEKLFVDNQDQAIEVHSRMPDMHDLYDIAQCVANPMYSDSTFI